MSRVKSSPIPISEDLIILAKTAVDYHFNPVPDKLAIMGLAARVVLEKAARYMQRKNASPNYDDIRDAVFKIMADIQYAEKLRRRLAEVRKLPKVWPFYKDSKLLD